LLRKSFIRNLALIKEKEALEEEIEDLKVKIKKKVETT
jgi:hypothetical protein